MGVGRGHGKRHKGTLIDFKKIFVVVEITDIYGNMDEPEIRKRRKIITDDDRESASKIIAMYLNDPKFRDDPNRIKFVCTKPSALNG